MVRVKNRYIVAKIILAEDVKSSTGYNDTNLTFCVLRNVEKYYGILGLGAVERGFRIKYCNDETRIVIMRCPHRVNRFVTSILPLITAIVDHKAKFQVLYVGATIMHCNKFIVKYQKDYLRKMITQIESAKQRKDLIENVMDFDVDQ